MEHKKKEDKKWKQDKMYDKKRDKMIKERNGTQNMVNKKWKTQKMEDKIWKTKNGCKTKCMTKRGIK